MLKSRSQIATREEAQGFRFGDGQELSRERITAFAATPGYPAAVAIQISHRQHRVANGYAAHGLPLATTVPDRSRPRYRKALP